ncbi:MAG: YbaK/EbsC family protein [Candidatus Nealsonbacteria bacterium]
MALPAKVSKFLDGVKHELIEHRTVYTAYDKSATLKIPQKIVGKTLVVKFDNEAGLVLIPANKNLDKLKLKKVISIWRKKNPKSFDFVKEAWMKKNLKGVKLGAVPPFGSLFKFPTFADKSLLKESEIFINSGNYDCSIKVTPAVFKKLLPDLIIGNFSKSRK